MAPSPIRATGRSMHKFQVSRLGLKAICAVPASIEYHRFFGWYYWMLYRSGTTLIVWGTPRTLQRLDGDVALMRYEPLRQSTFWPRRKRSRNCNTKRLPLRIRPSETVRVAVLGLALPRCRSDNPHFNGVSVMLWLRLTREPKTDLFCSTTKPLPSTPQDYPTSTSSFCGVISFQVRS